MSNNIEANFEIDWVGKYLSDVLNLSDSEVDDYLKNNEEEVEVLENIISLEHAYFILFTRVLITQNTPENLNRMRLKLIQEYETTYNKKYIRAKEFIF